MLVHQPTNYSPFLGDLCVHQPTNPHFASDLVGVPRLTRHRHGGRRIALAHVLRAGARPLADVAVLAGDGVGTTLGAAPRFHGDARRKSSSNVVK